MTCTEAKSDLNQSQSKQPKIFEYNKLALVYNTVKSDPHLVQLTVEQLPLLRPRVKI